MSDTMAREVFARTAADRMWQHMLSIRDLLRNGESHTTESQLKAISEVVESANKDINKYAAARGFEDAKV